MTRSQPHRNSDNTATPERRRWTKPDALTVARWLHTHDWQPLDTATCAHLAEQLGRTVKAVHAKGQALRTLHPDYDRPPMKTGRVDSEVVDEVLHGG
jgi:hypothetical protein